MLYDVYIHISILIATHNDYESDDDDYNESDNDDDSSEDDGDEDGSYSGGQKLSTIDKSTVDLSQHSSCPLCNHTLDKKNRKKTDQQTKDYIYEMTLEDIMRCSCRIFTSIKRINYYSGNIIHNNTSYDFNSCLIEIKSMFFLKTALKVGLHNPLCINASK